MTSAADVVFVDGEVHTLTEPDRTAEAIAVRDGEIVRIGETHEIEFLDGVETRRVNLAGRVLLPGFIDAHTHLEHLGQTLVHADLSEATDLEDLLVTLERDHDPTHDWILGFGYDESEFEDESRFPSREDLDRVSTDRPIAIFRVDMHSASLNSTAIEKLEAALPDEHLRTADGDPTGIVVEEAVDVVKSAIEPDRSETRDLLTVAMSYATERGVTGVHDMVRNSHAPAVYRDLDREGELFLRVTLNYWADHLEAIEELGLRPTHGSDFVQMGGIKTYTDGSLGSRTAQLDEPYEDSPTESGEWVFSPTALEALVEEVDSAGHQLLAHAIGDQAIRTVLDVLESTDPESNRHRVEHVELLDDKLLDQFAASGAIASVQPNFLKWAAEGGLYDDRLGRSRRKQSNRFGAMAEAGIPLAFGSDCMPMDPLLGIHNVVNAPTDAQQLPVTAALRAYTKGSAIASFDEERLGTIEPGKKADFVILDESPWENPTTIEDISVSMTVVEGETVYDGRPV